MKRSIALAAAITISIAIVGCGGGDDLSESAKRHAFDYVNKHGDAITALQEFPNSSLTLGYVAHLKSIDCEGKGDDRYYCKVPVGTSVSDFKGNDEMLSLYLTVNPDDRSYTVEKFYPSN